MVNEIRKEVPNAKLTYNNLPSFNWTLNLRKQVREKWPSESKIAAGDYPDGIELMKSNYDDTDLGREADARLQRFQTDISALHWHSGNSCREKVWDLWPGNATFGSHRS